VKLVKTYLYLFEGWGKKSLIGEQHKVGGQAVTGAWATTQISPGIALIMTSLPFFCLNLIVAYGTGRLRRRITIFLRRKTIPTTKIDAARTIVPSIGR